MKQIIAILLFAAITAHAQFQIPAIAFPPYIPLLENPDNSPEVPDNSPENPDGSGDDESLVIIPLDRPISYEHRRGTVLDYSGGRLRVYDWYTMIFNIEGTHINTYPGRCNLYGRRFRGSQNRNGRGQRQRGAL